MGKVIDMMEWKEKNRAEETYDMYSVIMETCDELIEDLTKIKEETDNGEGDRHI